MTSPLDMAVVQGNDARYLCQQGDERPLLPSTHRIHRAGQEQDIIDREGDVARMELDRDVVDGVQRAHDDSGLAQYGDELRVLALGDVVIGDAHRVVGEVERVAEAGGYVPYLGPETTIRSACTAL